MWTKAYNILADRAVYVVGTIQSGIAVGTAFGLTWTAEQVAATVAFSTAVLSLILGRMVVRR